MLSLGPGFAAFGLLALVTRFGPGWPSWVDPLATPSIDAKSETATGELQAGSPGNRTVARTGCGEFRRGRFTTLFVVFFFSGFF